MARVIAVNAGSGISRQSGRRRSAIAAASAGMRGSSSAM
jgi:hypothetical protein